MEIATHLAIDPTWSGRVTHLSEGKATVELVTLPAMGADEQGLVHGGFVFSAADYAAMVAVNDPHVVLGAAETRFLAPTRVGETVVLEAEITARKGRKHTVAVRGRCGETDVFSGTFTAFVLDAHVLAE